MRKMARQTPMRRNGQGEEIAAAVLFLRLRRSLLPDRYWLWMAGWDCSSSYQRGPCSWR